MDAVISSLIAQLNSSVFILLVILLVIIWMTFQAGSLVERFRTHEQKLDEARGIQNEMISIRTKVDLIYQNTNPNALFRTQSPLGLTPRGEAVAKELAVSALLDKHYPQLHRAVDNESPKTAYDIQVASLKAAREQLAGMLEEKDLNAIKDQAFKTGALLDDMLVIFGIMLRNRILAERGIPLTQVDLSDPASPKPV